MNDPKVIVAMDLNNMYNYAELLDKLDPSLCYLKIGKHMHTRFGDLPRWEARRKGFDVFLDLKFHDIPNTVGDAVEAAADLGVWMVNVHALGGQEMMETAMRRIEHRRERPKLIAVTVLTSLDADDLQVMGIMHTPGSLVHGLTNLVYKSGLDGIVCSSHELRSIYDSPYIDNNFLTVVPGIRPDGVDKNDQKRIMTPSDAINEGAKYLVIGRPITQAKDPLAALQLINKQIGG